MIFNISEATDCYSYSKYVKQFKKISFNDLATKSSYRIRILSQFQTARINIQNNMFNFFTFGINWYFCKI